MEVRQYQWLKGMRDNVSTVRIGKDGGKRFRPNNYLTSLFLFPPSSLENNAGSRRQQDAIVSLQMQRAECVLMPSPHNVGTLKGLLLQHDRLAHSLSPSRSLAVPVPHSMVVLKCLVKPRLHC